MHDADIHITHFGVSENGVLENSPHRRFNILNGEWVLVSAHRSKRPWHGQLEATQYEQRNRYEADCYLCPGNKRVSGEQNPGYQDVYVFNNDHRPYWKTSTPSA